MDAFINLKKFNEFGLLKERPNEELNFVIDFSFFMD